MQDQQSSIPSMYQPQVCPSISKTPSNGYYVSILVEEDVETQPVVHREVGIDLGLTDLIITSSGIKFNRVKKQLEKANRLLKKTQKKLAKKQNGSKSREKARIGVAKLYARITRIRNDYYHNIWFQKDLYLKPLQLFLVLSEENLIYILIHKKIYSFEKILNLIQQTNHLC